MDIEKLFTKEAMEKMRFEIEEANGNEVFFRGILDDADCVCEVEVIARGNISSVPAIINRMKKREIIIHNHPSGYLFPSDNDIKIASTYGQSGGGSYIVDNDITDVYVIVEPAKQLVKVDISEYFSENGIISLIFNNYEYRKEQEDMAKAIEKSLNTGKKAIIEAGTGTGKTLAYLIPSMLFGLDNNKKVIVSTNTINLQEQLISKDIPLVEKIIGQNFKKVIVKGRGNYLCIRKVKTINQSDFEGLSESQKSELKMILDWFGQTSWGDKAELDFEASYTIWEKANSEPDLCLRHKCIYKEKCFFMKARREAQNADLLITNHHIYFADLAIRQESGFLTDYAILPNYEIVVFDEAHNIEKVARDYFSHEISKNVFSRMMNNIYHYKGERTKSSRGAALKALDYLRGVRVSQALMASLEDIMDHQFIELHKQLFEKTDDFFTKAMEIFNSERGKNEIKIRLIPEKIENDEIWKNEILKRKDDVLRVSSNYFRKAADIELIIEEMDTEDSDGTVSDFLRYIERMKAFFKTFKHIFDMEDSEEFVYWLEINSKYNNINFYATPLNIKEDLQETLYASISNIVFTSATLAVGKNFTYFKDAIGLDNDSIEKIIKSPFDYKKQMRVIIPKDLKDPSAKDFLDDTMEFIKDVIRKTNGRAFILFTAYSTLNYLYYKIREDLQKEGFNLFVQGDYPRHRLLELFTSTDKAVLFGADSFWEGIDVRGDKLSSVILVKLPFKVPSEPVVEAIIENIEKNGGNPFMEYQIPEAVIKFKQGVGRLIRSKTDRGIITILDVRVISKAYGRLFLEALPNADIRIDNRENLV